jgi:hypothetical protein|tara:strand:- start:2201 stop:2422 length:222 start_codon:yes stop_codon:yes gene_type:complete
MRKGMKSKGYAKGGAKMMKAMGGKMAKGYAKGGAKMMKVKKTPLKASSAKTKKMTVAQLKKQAKMLGMKVSKA